MVADLRYLQPIVAALADETVAFGWQPGSVKPVSMRGDGARFVFQQIRTEGPR